MSHIKSVEGYKKIIKSKLSKKRYIHSLEVARSAVELSSIYGCDRKSAEIAGILHDVMKETPAEEQLKMMEGFGIILPDELRFFPKALHAISAAVYVERELDIQDTDIIGAIRWHTTGRAGMSTLEKVVFVADFISADREYPDVEVIRELAKKSLERAIVYGLTYTVKDLMDSASPLSIESIGAYNEALKKVNSEKGS